ncbi:MAG: hypothetical protein A2Z14_13965 [Chloroflexi bacterium RBG_16_48_8]|nr:MAG: hypothetical protein A2Z14_13965 [Chloroflexi bacterium RBG_16_48_8]
MLETSSSTTNAKTISRRRPIERKLGFEGVWARYGNIISNAISFSIFFIFWEIIGRSGYISKLILPPFSEVVSQTLGMAHTGELWKHLSFSATNFSVGFLISVVTGIPLGLMLGAFKLLDRIIGPYIWAFYSTPRIALLPIITVTIGFGMASKVLLIFIASFFIIVINTWAGVKTVEESLIRAGKVFCATRITIFTKIVVPYTLPFIIVGLRLAVTSALVITLVAEMLASSKGIGYVVMRAIDEFNSAKLWSMIIILVIVSMTIVSLLRKLESLIAPWREQSAV